MLPVLTNQSSGDGMLELSFFKLCRHCLHNWTHPLGISITYPYISIKQNLAIQMLINFTKQSMIRGHILLIIQPFEAVQDLRKKPYSIPKRGSLIANEPASCSPDSGWYGLHQG